MELWLGDLRRELTIREDLLRRLREDENEQLHHLQGSLVDIQSLYARNGASVDTQSSTQLALTGAPQASTAPSQLLHPPESFEVGVDQSFHFIPADLNAGTAIASQPSPVEVAAGQ